MQSQKGHQDRRLKVLFLTPWYPTLENPVHGIFVQEHAKAVQLKDDVVVFHSQRCAGLPQRWHVELESDRSLTAGLPTYRILHKQAALPNFSLFSELVATLAGLRRLRRQGFHPDILHAHTYTAGAVAVLLGKWLGVPTVVTEQSSEFPRKLVRGAGIWKARLAFGQAAMAMPVSMALQHAIEAYGIRAKFQVVPNVVDTSMFHPAPHPPGSPKQVLTVAMLDPSHNKGIPLLLQALAGLHACRNDWLLDIVGDGPARSEYEQLAKTLGLTDKVRFRGATPKPEVARWMQQADLFVLASRYETFSAVTAEALASGLPVLITQCGGPEEYVSSAVGMTVPVGDVNALQAALATMLDALVSYVPDRVAEYAASHFSPETVGQTLHAIYLEAKQSYGKHIAGRPQS